MKHFFVKSNDGDEVINNLREQCHACVNNCNEEGKLITECPIYKTKRRQGVFKNKVSSTFLCCDTSKTTKLFKEKLFALSYAFPDFKLAKEELELTIRREEQNKVNRLVHNLTTINAHSIQEIYDLVSQQTLVSHWKNQREVIEKAIKKDVKKAAMTYLRIAKHNIHMKSEFSIYRKLDRGDSFPIEIKEHSIRNVVLNVLHTFFSDFTNNNIYVRVDDFSVRIKFDYETIQVAIYHLIENAVKYAKPSSEITIRFQNNIADVKVLFEMISIYNSIEERQNILEEGVSGAIAKKMGKNGDGIGMWRIKQMMGLNSGRYDVVFGDDPEKVMGFDFARNTFILVFNK